MAYASVPLFSSKKHKTFERDKPGWIAAFVDAHKRKEKYIMVKNIQENQKKLTNLIERLKLESELKFTISGGNVFHKFTVHSVKKS